MEISKEDRARSEKAKKLMELTESVGWNAYLKPFLASLLTNWPDPKDYKDEHKLMLDYTRKCGEADAVKKILKELEDQPQIAQAIEKKYSDTEKKGII